MTGDKKIVGLWRDSAKIQEADSAAQADTAPPETVPAPEAAAPVEREWLDMSVLDADGDLGDSADDTAQQASAWRDRVAPALLVLLAIGWTGFTLAVATDNFARTPVFASLPTLIATIAMPLTLLAVLWMVLLRSGRSEQARFARVAAALREENLALNQSMHSLGLHLADAQKQMGLGRVAFGPGDDKPQQDPKPTGVHLREVEAA